MLEVYLEIQPVQKRRTLRVGKLREVYTGWPNLPRVGITGMYHARFGALYSNRFKCLKTKGSMETHS